MVLKGEEHTPQMINSGDYSIKKYCNDSVDNTNVGIQMISVYSSVTVGLNLPHLFFLHVSLNNFKPNKLNYPHCVKINDQYINVQYYNIINSLVQVIGRLTRYHNSETHTTRIVQCKNTPPYKGMVLFGLLIPHLKNSFTNINVIQLEKYEDLVFTIKNSRNLKKYLIFYNQRFKKNNESSISLKDIGLYYSNFKIAFIWLLKHKYKFTNQRFEFIFNLILLKFLKNCRP